MLTQQALMRVIAENPRMTQEELGVVFGVTKMTIGNLIKGWKIPYKKKSSSPATVSVDLEMLKGLISEGFNQPAIAKIMGVSDSTIYKRIKDYGLNYKRPDKNTSRKERPFEAFRKRVRSNYATATVLVRGELMVMEGRFVGGGKEWFREKVKTAFARRKEFGG